MVGVRGSEWEEEEEGEEKGEFKEKKGFGIKNKDLKARRISGRILVNANVLTVTVSALLDWMTLWMTLTDQRRGEEKRRSQGSFTCADG
ncbi:hypothetical protein IE53DRAFT_84468 [Violaceomyces palustris]|uniref:Uncharacterized protein n=1 Tax=Violaceomyces palustris TaxID=1673888 RepID=A0ACD0P758_9BASI|nr:hypothetical protein IE53DRAFT_84468 [Violaceomyces palustris]